MNIEQLVDESGNTSGYWAKGHVNKEAFAKAVNHEWLFEDEPQFESENVQHGRAVVSSDEEDMNDLPDFCEYSVDFGVNMTGDRTIEATYLDAIAQ